MSTKTITQTSESKVIVCDACEVEQISADVPLPGSWASTRGEEFVLCPQCVRRAKAGLLRPCPEATS